MDAFAKALQASSKTRPQQKLPTFSPEIENNLSSDKQNTSGAVNPFSEALARVGGTKLDGDNKSAADLEKEAQERERQQRRDALRLKLHKEINPVDLTELYSANEKKVQQELKQIRNELVAFAKESRGLLKEFSQVDVALLQTVVKQGQSGIGLRAFFDKLRQFIKLLRQQVHSARTWLNTAKAKGNKKKARKAGAGIEISGDSHEQTKAVFDQMHHEQSNSYSGS